MKLYVYLIIFSLFIGIGCREDRLPGDTSASDGKVTLFLKAAETPFIETRAGGEAVQEEEAIENVWLLIFDPATGAIKEDAYQQLIEQNNSVSIYLENAAQTIYAICNLPDTVRTKLTITNLSDLEDASIKIHKLDETYTGAFIMSGSINITPSLQSNYTIEVTRISAKIDFSIQFQPENPKEHFKLSAVYMHNIPQGSWLLERPYPAGANDTLDVCTADYVYATAADVRRNCYLPDSTWLDVSKQGVDAYTGSCYLFENRQGGVEDIPANWPQLGALLDQKPELYREYQQIYKRGLAEKFERKTDPYTIPETGFAYASYLSIHGVYETAGGAPFKVTYYVYLGKDNYKDFNIRRNHAYCYRITIHSIDRLDTRVEADPLGGLEVYGNFSKTLDAHCNTMEVLMYANSGWRVRVAEPDATPWLEVSRSEAYRPRMAGEAASDDKASFRLVGGSGLHYFYIHTDEYVPEIADDNPANNHPGTIRTGKIICETKNDRKEIVVSQYAAQMVILTIEKDIHSQKAVQDTFYVERGLEKKNMGWGFDYYWSFITDDLIASGQWDGLSNTRKLYQVALEGDKWGIDPAYPNGLTDDFALGYAVGKNRDRNGNGKIDADEIMWYLPAASELEALSEAVAGQLVELDEEMTNYHSSTPSVADPNGKTTGRSYYVDMTKRKKYIGLRTRKCNVLSCRRKNAWKGPADGSVEGSVGNDTEWGGEDEEIMPK